MEERDLFYSALGHYDNKVEHGKSILIRRELEYKTYITEPPEMQPLIGMTQAELKVKRAECVIRENKVWDKIKGLELEWEKCAARTLLVDRAMEYIRTPEVEHTNNEWQRREDGVWQISNRVYRMAYQIKEDRTNAAPWLCIWGIRINPPKRPETERLPYVGSPEVVEVKKKRFNAEADAQNYIQGRFNVYAHLFREVTPPVPYEFRRHFMINGCLLPDYTMLPQERKPQEVAAELAEFLDDEPVPLPANRGARRVKRERDAR